MHYRIVMVFFDEYIYDYTINEFIKTYNLQNIKRQEKNPSNYTNSDFRF